MTLSERLDKALDSQKLQPCANLKNCGVNEPLDINAPRPVTNGSRDSFSTLEAALKDAHHIEPDEFGVRTLLVDRVEGFDYLPMEEHIVDEFIVDDVQKRNDGGYEVHLVEKNRKQRI